ncbi:MAG TPA: protein-glutamate O-methyltransferase CheR [Caulobacteraceae bacterium]|nr:protein-glutamate O-methyltransferase CheR [Caulobacteraceae bacterium]
MRAEEIALVVAICRTRAGLEVAPEKTYLIESRLAPVARREGFETISELLEAIRARRQDALIWATVEAMAAGETGFFRDRAPFQHLKDELIPRLARSRGGRGVRIWSAAASSGQEVYSIAMIAAELMDAGAPLRIDLAASDLSSRALERARAGLYDQFEVQRGLPIRLLARHFRKSDESWGLSETLRAMVRWRRINLIAGLAALGSFDVVFCRYVLGSMTRDAQRRVLEELTAVVAEDGYLVLGLDEDVAGLAETFRPIVGRPGLYRRNPDFRAAAAA